MLTGEVAQRAHDLGRDVPLLPDAAVALHARAWPVARQLEPVGGAAQLVRPVLEQLVDELAVELLALPLGEVGVLDR